MGWSVRERTYKQAAGGEEMLGNRGGDEARSPQM